MLARLLLTLFLLAAPRAEAARPKIGLVLSGGGARGSAHVGVLKVLEELRIPVDYVVGTSMGSAVGGLYALGLSAAELENIFSRFDWNASFADRPARDGLSFRRKQDDFDFLIGRGIGLRQGKLRFPLGAVQGQVFLGELRSQGGITREYRTFDALPIPFRCVATDLVSAEPVIISSGDLALAIRASVAAAPLFSPVAYQGRLLIDGGYLNNIPVDAARAMGAERLIVVNIGTQLAKLEGLESVFDVFSQAARVGGEQFDRAQLRTLGKGDLLLTPDLGDLRFGDFDRIADGIRLGEAAAREAAPRLRALALSEEEYRAFRAARRPRSSSSPVVDKIEVETDARISPRIIELMIRQKAGEPLDLRTLQEDLLRVHGLGYFDFVDYSVVARGTEQVLKIKAPKLSWGPGRLRFGLDIAEDFRRNSVYGLSGQFTRMDLNRAGGELRLKANVGTEPRVEAELFQPVAYQPSVFRKVWAPIFLAPRVGYARTLFDLTADEGTARYRVGAPYVALDGGYFLSNVAELRAGIERSWNRADLIFGPAADAGSSPVWNGADFFARATLDTLDHASFPYRGAYLEAELREGSKTLGSGVPSRSLDTGGVVFGTRGRHTLGAKAIYSTNLDLDSRTPRVFQLGGLLRLSGFPENSLVGTDRILAQLRYFWTVDPKAVVPIKLGSAVEWGGTWLGRSRVTYDSGFWAGSLILGLDTGIGPFFLGQSFASRGRTATTLLLGHTF